MFAHAARDLVHPPRTEARSAKVLAAVVMLLFGVLGGFFTAAYAFEDPGGSTAAWMTAAWLVPMLVLGVVAVVWPGPARRVFVGLTVVVVAAMLLDGLLRFIPEALGPVNAVVLFALGVPVALLGLRTPRLAGVLLIALAAGLVLAQLIATTVMGSGGAPVAGVIAAMGVRVFPALFAGLLFLLAGRATLET